MASIKGRRGGNAAIREINIGTIDSLSTVVADASRLLADPWVL
jgi:hypothetical protein